MSEHKPSSTTRVGFVSLGCPKNLVDSEIMLGTLASRGYEITADPEAADVIVVNTCSFIDSAREESIDTILEMSRLKTEGRCQKLVVAGCLAQRYRDQIASELPEVDLAFGPDELGRILEAVGEEAGAVSIDALYTSREVPTIPRLRTTARHLAYLKISEGCDHTCAFCAIPSFRGAFRSRRADELVREAATLAADGVQEIVLVSQDTLAWGRDLEGENSIVSLLSQLLDSGGFRWIRLLYCYPNLLTHDLVGLISRESRLCNYFDIPYQHASAPVLNRMRRGGSPDLFLRQLEGIRTEIPDASVRTSFIVGFPGETDSHFRELAGFVEDAGFDQLGVFLYSDEEGTRACELDQKVDRETAIQRRHELMECQARITKKRLARRIGLQAPVLLEGPSRESELLLEGRTEGQAPEIDGRVLINDSEVGAPVAGQFYLTEFTDVVDYDLLGRIIRPC